MSQWKWKLKEEEKNKKVKAASVCMRDSGDRDNGGQTLIVGKKKTVKQSNLNKIDKLCSYIIKKKLWINHRFFSMELIRLSLPIFKIILPPINR